MWYHPPPTPTVVVVIVIVQKINACDSSFSNALSCSVLEGALLILLVQCVLTNSLCWISRPARGREASPPVITQTHRPVLPRGNALPAQLRSELYHYFSVGHVKKGSSCTDSPFVSFSECCEFVGEQLQ